ncbi:MAG: zf-HC2 domain-containing protein [Proteobacteria bacterium]|nr:zf-HC2 domain-containing protein [Pseudomonadota bacterium]
MAPSEATRGDIDVLDDVLDKEAGAKRKVIAHSGGVGSGVRHLSQDELDAYVNGRLPAARLDSCSNHLDSCDACRAELEDLRTFKSNAAGLSKSGSLSRELDRRKRQRQLKAAGSAAMVAAVVAAIAAVGWWQFGKARAQRTSKATTAATSAAQEHAQALTGGAVQARTASAEQSHGSGSLATVAQAPAPTSSSASQLRSTLTPSNPLAGGGHERTATATTSPHAANQPAAAAAPPANTFALLGPFGDEIADARPEFAWQPLAGATKYSVVIVDEGLRPVQRSHGVRTTSWRPPRPLRRGRTYLWQVTATLRNGTKIVATSPTSLEARIHITQAPSDQAR